MAPDELPLRCLAVSVVLDEAGGIDGRELEAFLNKVAGCHQWISTRQWLFVEPPVEVGKLATVPVVVPEAIATKAVICDLTVEPQRLFFDYAISPVETRKWRWVAFQIRPNPTGDGIFPWEMPIAPQ